jgi:transposase InsO family protein
VLLIEAKTHLEVERLLRTRPDEWRLENDKPIFIPARDAFARWGLRHVVWTNEHFNQVFSSNAQLLLQARQSGLRASAAEETRVFRFFTDHVCETLSVLAAVLGSVDTTPILSLIEQGRLFARLDQDLLSMPGTAWISAKPGHLAALPKLLVDGRMIPAEGLVIPSEKELADAEGRLAALKTGSAPTRTLYRHRVRIADGAKQGKSELASLTSRNHLKGNRTDRLATIQLDTLDSCLDLDYGSPNRASRTHAYNRYVLLAREAHPHYRPVSRTTFSKFLARKDPASIAAARQGRRAGNSAARPTGIETRAIPALRPFEQASIDHCQIALFVAFGADSPCEPLKPWLTALRDVATGAILAIWISLRAPSRAHVFAVLRRCARTFGRLPERIHSDRGSNLRSTAYLAVTAELAIDVSHSPAGYSRFNSAVENIFGIAQLELFQGLPGNAVHAVGNRQASLSHNSKTLAEISPEDLWRLMLAYVEHFNNTATDIFAGTPISRMRAGLEQFPASGKKIELTPEFLVTTSVEANGYKVSERNGIKVGPQYFYSPSLASRIDPTRKVPVRTDPENPHVIYARIDQRWHACEASRNPIFARMTDAERCIEFMRLVDAQHLNLQIRSDRQQKAISLQRKILSVPPDAPPQGPSEHETAPRPSVFDLARRSDVPPSLTHYKEASLHVLDSISQTEPR